MDWMLMPLRRYADFSGRSRRMEYWMFVLFLMVATMAVAVVEVLLGIEAALAGAGPLSLVLSLALFVPSIAVGVRRLHDTNRSGWWLLSPLPGYAVFVAGIATAELPVVAIGGFAALALSLALLIFMCLPGTEGPNRFGPDPKGAGAAEAFA